MRLNELLRRLKGVERARKGWLAFCPAHPDVKPTLSIRLRKGKLLLLCHAGCSEAQILEKLGLAREDLRVEQGPDTGGGHQPSQFHNGQLVGHALPDAPGAQLRVPAGYRLDVEGTWSVSERGGEEMLQRIAHSPIVIARRLYDAEEHVEHLQLAWRRADGWRQAIVERGVALDARRLVSLANEGFPVSSGNAGQIVRYLEAFEAMNYASLPVARVSAHLGWQGTEGCDGFLWGRNWIAPDGERVVISTGGNEIPDEGQQGGVGFRALAPGDAQIAEGFHSAGTLSAWVEAVAILGSYPKAALALYAACVPPLLSILRAPNFILDYAGRTSTGKTTALRVAASVWGRPDEKAPDGALGTWDATKVWIERSSAVLHDLPLILDDTKRAKSAQLVGEVLYLVASGRGRGRGNLRSLSRVGVWRTVLISSGESRVTSYTQDGGTRARTLEVVGLPFDREDPKTGQQIDQLNAALLSHYGHAGPLLVRWLLRHRESWTALVQMYRLAVERYAAHRSGAMRRLAHYAAAIEVAAFALHAVLAEANCPLPWPSSAPLERLWETIAAEAEEAQAEVRALLDVVSWAYSNQQAFVGRHGRDARGNPRQPPGGWAGKWEGGDDWTYIAFYPTVVRRVLRQEGYEPDAILQAWRARGWLECDQDRRRYEKRLRLAGDRVWMIVIPRKAVEEAGADGAVGDAVGTPVGTA